MSPVGPPTPSVTSPSEADLIAELEHAGARVIDHRRGSWGTGVLNDEFNVRTPTGTPPLASSATFGHMSSPTSGSPRLLATRSAALSRRLSRGSSSRHSGGSPAVVSPQAGKSLLQAVTAPSPSPAKRRAVGVSPSELLHALQAASTAAVNSPSRHPLVIDVRAVPHFLGHQGRVRGSMCVSFYVFYVSLTFVRPPKSSP